MGTRADFYVGRGKDAEWLGSIAMDGYPSGLSDEDSMQKRAPRSRQLLASTTEQGWRDEVAAFLARREDATRPADGWPWPWDNSGTTDYAYAFDAGKVWGSCFGGEWFDPLLPEPEDDPTEAKVPFPDMSSRKAVTLGPRSGLIVVRGPGREST
jgi:hypothetical protein